MRFEALSLPVSPYFAKEAALKAEMINLVGGLPGKFRSDGIMFLTVPNLGTGTRGGKSVVVVDFDELEVIKQLLAEDRVQEYVPSISQ